MLRWRYVVPIVVSLAGLAATWAAAQARVVTQEELDAPREAPPEGNPELEGWTLIGYRRLTTSGETVIQVHPSEGQFRHVRFEAQERGITVDSVRFELQGDAEPIEVQPRERIREGAAGGPIDLTERATILRARVRYRLAAGGGRAILNLLGQRPEEQP